MAVDAVRLLVDLIANAEGDQTIGHLQDELFYSVQYAEVREIAEQQGIDVQPYRIIKLDRRAGRCFITDYSGRLIHTLYDDTVDYREVDESELLHEVWEYHWDYVVDHYYRLGND